MGRLVKTKQLSNARLLKEYASWVYCDTCSKTVAYLCYVTYASFDFEFHCHCGKIGTVFIDFEDSKASVPSDSEMVIKKNRFCCPQDGSALLTIVEKNLQSYSCKITCQECGYEYIKTKK